MLQSKNLQQLAAQEAEKGVAIMGRTRITSEMISLSIERIYDINLKAIQLLEKTRQEEMFLKSILESRTIDCPANLVIDILALQQYSASIERLKEQMDKIYIQIKEDERIGCDIPCAFK